ncbi:MAG: Asp-tRNA(Asn)/Glu-tRNA(Gln) amidotransferase subunit GatC [Burkholderiales bacterium]|nr:Asp-tRNA(Asn)/Glu-tRNA(Gln) amidotransferase subunit GatC [Burkholderiales bacterium]GIK86770.1 MAG: aspartyl/glutamyl-tRNA(Asn/Gln) amidotransferase subunit C [Betaproteobacteria bacterium]
MKLTPDDVARIAGLARLEVTPEESLAVQPQLEAIFGLLDQLAAVDTTGVAPLAHPQECFAPLREDRVTEGDQRELLQSVAPAVEDGLYLVPKVIE